jgi:hypothetical protein
MSNIALDLTNNDFLLGVLAAFESELRVEWVATGSMEHSGGFVGFVWQLISQAELDVYVLVLFNSEGGIEWKGELPGITKSQVTEGLIGPYRGGAMGGLLNLALLLTGESASVNTRWISKRLLSQAIRDGLKDLPESFDKNRWSKRVGFK